MSEIKIQAVSLNYYGYTKPEDATISVMAQMGETSLTFHIRGKKIEDIFTMVLQEIENQRKTLIEGMTTSSFAPAIEHKVIEDDEIPY